MAKTQAEQLRELSYPGLDKFPNLANRVKEVNEMIKPLNEKITYNENINNSLQGKYLLIEENQVAISKLNSLLSSENTEQQKAWVEQQKNELLSQINKLRTDLNVKSEDEIRNLIRDTKGTEYLPITNLAILVRRLDILDQNPVQVIIDDRKRHEEEIPNLLKELVALKQKLLPVISIIKDLQKVYSKTYALQQQAQQLATSVGIDNHKEPLLLVRYMDTSEPSPIMMATAPQDTLIVRGWSQVGSVDELWLARKHRNFIQLEQGTQTDISKNQADVKKGQEITKHIQDLLSERGLKLDSNDSRLVSAVAALLKPNLQSKKSSEVRQVGELALNASVICETAKNLIINNQKDTKFNDFLANWKQFSALGEKWTMSWMQHPRSNELKNLDTKVQALNDAGTNNGEKLGKLNEIKEIAQKLIDHPKENHINPERLPALTCLVEKVEKQIADIPKVGNTQAATPQITETPESLHP